MSDDIELLLMRLKGCAADYNLDPSDTAGVDELTNSAADEIERMRARNRLMTELMNDVLGVAPDRKHEQVWCLNLSRSSSVGLPPKFLDLWRVPDEQQ